MKIRKRKECVEKGCNKHVVDSCWECDDNLCEEHSKPSARHRLGHLCLKEDCGAQHEEPVAWWMNIAPNGESMVAKAVEHQIVGLGWPVPIDLLGTEYDFDDFERLASKTYEDHSWKGPLRKFENGIAVGDLIWTYLKEGHRYYLGKIQSDWRHVEKSQYGGDLVNVRDCSWIPVNLEQVPSSALHNRGILGELPSLGEYSDDLFRRRDGSTDIAFQRHGEPWDYLGPSEIEDAVALYLQMRRGYLVLPSTGKNSTPDIEAALIHKQNGDRAFFQVKSKKAAIDYSDMPKTTGRVFVLSLANDYWGPQPPNVEKLDKKEIAKFLLDAVDLLPSALRFAVENASLESFA